MTALRSWSSNTVHGSNPRALLLRRLLVRRTYLRPRNRSHMATQCHRGSAAWQQLAAAPIAANPAFCLFPLPGDGSAAAAGLLVLFPAMGRRRGFLARLAMTSATPRRRSSLTRFLKAAGERVVVGHVNMLISYRPASKQAKQSKLFLDPTMRTTGSGEAERLGLLSSGCC